MKRLLTSAVAAGAILAASGAWAQDSVFVGHIADYSGATSDVSKPYGQGVADALKWLNENGGVDGTMIEFETVDYSYEVPRAISTYKKWMSQKNPVALQGWGTGDTEALVSFVAKDEVPYFSASYSGHLTDPMGKSPRTKKPAPYNFFYGPSYSDGCRGLVQWAADDWKKKGGEGAPKFVHMGDNHPYPNAPKEACAAYAEELGFEVLDPILYSLKPGDFKAQCLTLKQSGANYAYLANTGGSTISLLKSCDTVGVDVQFVANVWGMDENALKATGTAGDGVAWVVGAATWNDDAPGMKTVREISKMSDPTGEEYRVGHYMRGICSVFFMRDAMRIAKGMDGGITGPNIKKAMETFKNHVPEELEGVCLPHTWTAENHRGTTEVLVYRANVADDGSFEMEHVFSADLPRREDWLGW